MVHITAWWFERRFGVLVAMLSAYLFVLAPLSRAGLTKAWFTPLLLTVVVVAGIQVCSVSRRAFAAAVVLAVPAVALMWTQYFLGLHQLRPALWLLIALFIVFLFVISSREVLTARYVTSDTILGAVAVYLQLAMVWALLYAFVNAMDQAAFTVPAFDAARVRDYRNGDVSIFVYYSFITLTTTGYGDITPASHTARGLASCEAVVGQIYLAVLVARLVALHVAHGPKPEA